MGTFSYGETSYPIHCKEYLLSLMREQGLEPVLIVIGGSRARKCYNERSDIDIFAHHIGRHTIGFDNTYELRKIFDVSNDICVQFSSEGIGNTIEHLVNHRMLSTNTRRLDIIENFMCFVPIYQSNVAESIRNHIRKIKLNTIVSWYHELALSLNDEYMNNELITDKMALKIIRTGLTSLWMKQTGIFTIDVPMLTKWAGIDIDWLEIFQAKNRYRNRVYWLHRIKTVVDKLQ